MTIINKQWTVRSLVLRHPDLTQKLNEKGIGPSLSYLTLEAVAVRLGCPADDLIAELTEAALK